MANTAAAISRQMALLMRLIMMQAPDGRGSG